MKTTNDANVMYFHGTTYDDYRFTIAGIVEGTNELIMSAAVCSGNELFNKSKGRLISSGRLLNQRNTAGHRVSKVIPSGTNKIMTYFTNEASNYSLFSRKELLKSFGLYNPKK